MNDADGHVLVTGGAGFIGCNLADRLAVEGHDVTLFDNFARAGAETNYDGLKRRHGARIRLRRADIRDAGALEDAVRDAKVVFHLAAQVAVTHSLANPREDFSVNVEGAVNLLEALRRRGGETPLIFASTNKVYGDLADVEVTLRPEGYAPANEDLRRRGVSEARPLSFCTPYGCSKGAADQYVLDYAHSFGLPTAVMRMSCIYGPHQMGNEDQGWVAHFAIRALKGEAITLFGDGQQVRDILYVDDAVDAYIAAWRGIARVRGLAFNLGGGPANAVSLATLLAFLEARTGRKLMLRREPWRSGDQRYYVSDTTCLRETLALPEPRPWREGVDQLLDWLQAGRPEAAAEAAE